MRFVFGMNKHMRIEPVYFIESFPASLLSTHVEVCCHLIEKVVVVFSTVTFVLILNGEP